MEESYFKKYFGQLFHLNKFILNFIGGIVLGFLSYDIYNVDSINLYTISFDMIKSNPLIFLVGFIFGFIYINFLIKEIKIRIITLSNFLYFIVPIFCSWLGILYLLSKF
jgi:hypothetical protein